MLLILSTHRENYRPEMRETASGISHSATLTPWFSHGRANTEMSTFMKHTLMLAMGLVSVVQLACNSEDASQSGSPAGGAASVDRTAVNGGSTNSTVASIGGATAGGAPGTETTRPAITSDFKVAINEIVPANKTGAIDEAGAYPDWLELYNHGTTEVSLAGFRLTDTIDDTTKGVLDAALKIPAGGVLRFWADGDVDEGSAHLSFKLAASGEGLFLFDPDQKLVDSVEWTTANPDAAFARFPDGTGAFSWCTTPTPNKVNGSACGG